MISDLLVAKRENYKIETVKADMTKTFPFSNETFDLIFHPVSNCYIEDVMHVWKECFRVLKKGGILMSGLDNGINFLFEENSENEKEIKYKLPFNPLKDNNLLNNAIKNNDGIQFSHTIEEQIRGQLKVGFKLEDIYEDTNGYGILHEYNIPTFWATLSVKQ
nr:methyltransferase domain-containing protein [Brachyspira alvinipulli]